MEAVLLRRSEIDPLTWDRFIQASPQGMLYSCYDYISIMEPDWQAVVVRSNETIHAVFPFAQRRKGGFILARQPVFAQYWGVCFRPIEAGVAKAFDLKKQWLKLIIAAVPAEIRLFAYSFSPAFDYPLPFHWSGFTLSVRYTCQIDLRRSEEALWANTSENNRRDIRKAQKAGITVSNSGDIDTVIGIFRKAKEQDVRNITGDDYTKLRDVAAHFHPLGACDTLIARTPAGEAIAGIIFFRFGRTTVYFFGSTDPDYKTSGAMSLIIWEGMLRGRQNTETFDFEGSMIEPVERFFRGFGATPVPYLHIQRNTLPWLVQKAVGLRAWLRDRKSQRRPG